MPSRFLPKKQPSFFAPGQDLERRRTAVFAGYQGLETRKAIILNPANCGIEYEGFPCFQTLISISFQSRTQTITCQKNALYFLRDLFEAFVFGNSSFALTLLALFAKIEIKGIIYWGNFTRQEDQGQKSPLVLGNFYSFSTSGRPLSSSTDLVTALSRFHEQCSLEDLELKFL